MARISSERDVHGVKLHSDNGSPMKGATMLATLQKLNVLPSFSRPRVSNDNPYSESLFRTLKYTIGYPKSFNSIEEAREEWKQSIINARRLGGVEQITKVPFLTINMPCGQVVQYETFEDIPSDDVPCPCGDDTHFVVEYCTIPIKEEENERVS